MMQVDILENLNENTKESNASSLIYMLKKRTKTVLLIKSFQTLIKLGMKLQLTLFPLNVV